MITLDFLIPKEFYCKSNFSIQSQPISNHTSSRLFDDTTSFYVLPFHPLSLQKCKTFKWIKD